MTEKLCCRMGEDLRLLRSEQFCHAYVWHDMFWWLWLQSILCGYPINQRAPLTSHQSCRLSTKPLNSWTGTELLASSVTHEASFSPDLCFVSTASAAWEGIKQSWSTFCSWHLSNIPLPNRVGWGFFVAEIGRFQFILKSSLQRG